jgi:hypothetical protein
MTRILVLIILSCCGACSAQSVLPKPDLPEHHTETGFTNPYIDEPDKGFFPF